MRNWQKLKALTGAFIIFLNSPLVATVAADATACPLSGSTERAQIASIVDGDTLVLLDGRHVRVLGIDTPELAHVSGVTDQPLAQEAKAYTVSLLAKKGVVSLHVDQEARDDYGRILAQVLSNDGKDLAAELLRQGYATLLTVPPNLTLAPCYAVLERDARDGRRGLWQLDHYQKLVAKSLPLNYVGYVWATGTVTDVLKGKDAYRVTLDNRLDVHLQKSDVESMDPVFISPKRGDKWEVRGMAHGDGHFLHMRIRDQWHWQKLR